MASSGSQEGIAVSSDFQQVSFISDYEFNNLRSSPELLRKKCDDALRTLEQKVRQEMLSQSEHFNDVALETRFAASDDKIARLTQKNKKLTAKLAELEGEGGEGGLFLRGGARAELVHLREEKQRLQRDQERILQDFTAERARADASSKMVDELSRTNMALESEKLKYERESTVAASQVAPLKEDASITKLENERLEKLVQKLEQDLRATENKLTLEMTSRADQMRLLTQQVTELKSDNLSKKESLEMSRQNEASLRESAEKSDVRFKELQKHFADERRDMQTKLELKEQQLDIETQSREELKKMREEAEAQLDEVNEELGETRTELDTAKQRISTLENQVFSPLMLQGGSSDQAAQAQANLQSIVPAEMGQTVSEMVESWVQSKQAAADEARQRLEYEHAYKRLLREVEREGPRVQRERQELESLRAINIELTRANEQLIGENTQNRKKMDTVNMKLAKAERSAAVKADMVSEFQQQVSVLTLEVETLHTESLRAESSFGARGNRRASAPAQPKSRTLAINKPGSLEPFRRIQDLVQQNVSLREANSHLVAQQEKALAEEVSMMREESERKSDKMHSIMDQNIQTVDTLQTQIERLQKENEELRGERIHRVGGGLMPIAGSPQRPGSVRDVGSPGLAVAAATPSKVEAINDELRTKNETLHQELSKYKGDAADFKARSTKAEAAANFAEERKKAVEKERDDLRNRLHQSRGRVQQLENGIIEKENQTATAQADCQKAKMDLQREQRNVSSLQMKLDGAEKRASQAEKSMDQAVAEKSTIQQQLLEVQGNLQFLRNQGDTRVAELKSSYEQTQKSLSDNMDVLRNNAEQYKKERDERDQLFQEKSKALETALSQFGEASTEKAKLQEQLNVLKRELEHIRANPAAAFEASNSADAEDATRTREENLLIQYEQAKERIAELEKREKDLERQNKTFATLSSGYESKQRQLMEEIQALRGNSTNADTKANEAALKMSKATEKANEAQGMLAEKEHTITQLTQQVKDLRQQLDASTKQQKAELEKEAISHQGAGAKAQEAESARAELQKKYRDEIEAHGKDIARIRTLEGEVETLRAQARNAGSSSAADYDRLQKRADGLENELKAAQASSALAEKRVAALEQQNLAWSDHFGKALSEMPEDGAVGSSLDSADAQVKSLKGVLKTQQLDTATIKNRLKEVEVDLARAKRECDTLRIEREHAYEQLNKEQEMAGSLHKKVMDNELAAEKLAALSQMENDIKTLRSELKVAREQIAKYEAAGGKPGSDPQVATLKSQLKHKEDLLKKKEGEITNLQGQMTAMRGRQQTLTKDSGATAEKQKAWDTEKSKLEADLKKVQADMATKDKELAAAKQTAESEKKKADEITKQTLETQTKNMTEAKERMNKIQSLAASLKSETEAKKKAEEALAQLEKTKDQEVAAAHARAELAETNASKALSLTEDIKTHFDPANAASASADVTKGTKRKVDEAEESGGDEKRLDTGTSEEPPATEESAPEMD